MTCIHCSKKHKNRKNLIFSKGQGSFAKTLKIRGEKIRGSPQLSEETVNGVVRWHANAAALQEKLAAGIILGPLNNCLPVSGHILLGLPLEQGQFALLLSS